MTVHPSSPGQEQGALHGRVVLCGVDVWAAGQLEGVATLRMARYEKMADGKGQRMARHDGTQWRFSVNEEMNFAVPQ